MRRVGNLMPLVADFDNLRESFLLASRGKALNREVICFRENLNAELFDIHEKLLNGCYRFGVYYRFMVYDPKPRMICAAPFRDRVVFHAMMRVCHDTFDRFQIYDSYASRIGKGTYKAIERAQQYCAQYKWFVKLDACKYFDSIHHEVMKILLRRLFKDKLLISYFDALIDGYEISDARGLPIGNLTSQYFANHYLALADHYMKEKLKAKAMIRYMDDIVIWDNDKTHLIEIAIGYKDFVERELRLKLHPLCFNKTESGLSFLGYVIKPHILKLNQRSKHRYRTRMKKLNQKVESGILSQEEGMIHVQCMHAFVEKADYKKMISSLKTIRS